MYCDLFITSSMKYHLIKAMIDSFLENDKTPLISINATYLVNADNLISDKHFSEDKKRIIVRLTQNAILTKDYFYTNLVGKDKDIIPARFPIKSITEILNEESGEYLYFRTNDYIADSNIIQFEELKKHG